MGGLLGSVWRRSSRYHARPVRNITSRGPGASLRSRPPEALAAPEPERLVAILSSDSRKGRWTVPAHLEARSVLGDCRIELQDAVLTSHVTRIDARTTLGSVTIVVPDGVEVRLSGRSILGEKSSRVSQASLPGAPVIEVRANVILGNVTVLPATLKQVLRASVEEWMRPGLDQRSGGG